MGVNLALSVQDIISYSTLYFQPLGQKKAPPPKKQGAACAVSMLVQGKEKRVVDVTHEPLVDTNTFDAIQKSFQIRAYHVVPQRQSTENILKGKVICGCCGGKMQRKCGTNHADWYFFTCITKNRLGATKCTGMYAREEDIIHAIYQQLENYVKEHFISDSQYKQQMREFNVQIADLSKQKTETWICAMKCYEQFVRGEINREEFCAVQNATTDAQKLLTEATKHKDSYEKQYATFRKLLLVSNRKIPLSNITDIIDKIIVYNGGKIVVKWSIVYIMEINFVSRGACRGGYDPPVLTKYRILSCGRMISAPTRWGNLYKIDFREFI